MTCQRSFTTETGTFTAYPELVSQCKAESLCKQKGQILAPFTNDKDMRKASEVFKANNDNWETCDHAAIRGDWYHIGLYVDKDVDGEYKMSFSNGDQWDEEKHGKLYTFTEFETQCPQATFIPEEDSIKLQFGITEQSEDCDYEDHYKYICLKPANPASADPLVQHPAVNKENFLFSGPFVAILIVAFVAVFFACFTFFLHRKNNRSKEKLSEMEGKMKAGFYGEEV